MRFHRKKMSLLAAVFVLGAGSIAAVTGFSGAAGAAGGIAPEPIPPGYNFPTPKPVIDKWVAANDVAAMRNHAWDVWAGMASPSKVAGLPIWETWYSNNEVFSNSPLPAAAQRSRPARPFISPNQFHHQATLAAFKGKLGASRAEQVVAFNKFNGPSGQFIRTPHPTPPGSPKSYTYSKKKDLEALDASWPAATKPIDRKIVDFPREATDLKPVMWLVQAKNLTPFPFWQGPAQSSDPKNPTPETWFNCVLVDPAAKAGGLRPVTAADQAKINANSGLACKKYVGVAPLSMFYSFALNAAEAVAFNSAQGGSVKAQAGDFSVLAAMHVTTKEDDNWTWQTFWWQAGQNPPNNFPGGMQNVNAKVKGAWRNYAMCTAYSMVVPFNDPKGKPVVCFNPFLETSPGIPDGLNSNCMTCHGRATMNSAGNTLNYPATYLPNGWTNFNDPALFGKMTRTDFAWAIPGNAN